MKRPLWVILAFAAILTGCATHKVQSRLDRNQALVAQYQCGSASVILAYPDEKYERFRSSLESEITSRYVGSEEAATYSQIEVIIDEVHFIHKGASFATGGASGGNWIKGKFLLHQGDSSQEFTIYKSFNTGGGYTIFQDWEKMMIESVLSQIDDVLINLNR